MGKLVLWTSVDFWKSSLFAFSRLLGLQLRYLFFNLKPIILIVITGEIYWWFYTKKNKRKKRNCIWHCNCLNFYGIFWFCSSETLYRYRLFLVKVFPKHVLGRHVCLGMLQIYREASIPQLLLALLVLLQPFYKLKLNCSCD